MKPFYKITALTLILCCCFDPNAIAQDTLHLTLESAEITVAQSIDVQYTKMDAQILRYEADSDDRRLPTRLTLI